MVINLDFKVFLSVIQSKYGNFQWKLLMSVGELEIINPEEWQNLKCSQSEFTIFYKISRFL